MNYSEFFTAYCNLIENGTQSERDELVSENLHHFSMKFHRDYVDWLKAKDKPKYIYMLTFTLSPKLHPVITDALVSEVEAFVRKQGCRSALKVISYDFVKELHKNGRPHWHAVITAERSLKKSLFKYYTLKYGNIDLSRTKGKTDQEALLYISKSGATVEKVL